MHPQRPDLPVSDDGVIDVAAVLGGSHPYQQPQRRLARPGDRSESQWQAVWRYVVGAVVICLLGWFAFVRATPVPLLSMADLGFHELGHLVGYVLHLPQPITAALGSLQQVLVPALLAAYFFTGGFGARRGLLPRRTPRFTRAPRGVRTEPRRRDLMAGSLMLAWAGTAAQNVSVYVADAPYQRLPLLGGDGSVHDWGYLLGSSGCGCLERAAGLSGLLWSLGLAALLSGLVICLAAPLWLSRREESR